MATALGAREVTVLPSALYPATLNAVCEIDGAGGPRIAWTWTVTDPRFPECPLRSWFRRVGMLTPRTDAGSVVSALLGLPPGCPEERHSRVSKGRPEERQSRVSKGLAHLVGRPVRLSLVLQVRADGSVRNVIREVLPAARRAVPLRTLAPPVRDASDPDVLERE